MMIFRLLCLSLLLGACGGMTADNAGFSGLSSEFGPGNGNKLVIRSIHLNGVELNGQVLTLEMNEEKKPVIR